MTTPTHKRLILLAALAISCLLACAHAPEAPRFTGAPKAFELFQAIPEAETSRRAEQRRDLYVNTASGEPVPYVVGRGQISDFNRQGGRVRLFGDAAGTLGFSVDNFVLIEIARPDGVLLQRVAIGFQQGASIGSEQIDTVGPMQFQFGPGEIDLTRFIPANEPVVITATVLDTGSVGSASALYLVLSEDTHVGGNVDDFRD
ncbi:MAG: hypothetical protein IJC63_07400 [Myxococcaceae bacterium]|nr:hypothetical protein [Myxococcaceae bacterium]MBR2979914.1 hypothetical protein [Myxococcaceae bacterium]